MIPKRITNNLTIAWNMKASSTPKEAVTTNPTIPTITACGTAAVSYS